MSIRLVTEDEISATAGERFRESYRHWNDDDRFSTPGRPTKGEQIAALNDSDQTPDEIAAILNEGWARPRCDVCSKFVAVVVQMQDEWDADKSACFCADCLAKATRMISRLASAPSSPPEPVQ